MSNGVKLAIPSASGSAVQRLCAAYDAAADLYATCAYPMGGSDKDLFGHARMPIVEASRYESAIRRAMLATCENLPDFFHMLNDTREAGFTERRLKETLRDAFEARRKMPYDRFDINRSVIEANEDGTLGLPKPFHPSNAHNMMTVSVAYPHVKTRKILKSLATVEYAPGAANFCFTKLPGNDMDDQIPRVAQLFYGMLSKHPHLPPLQGRGIRVFMHTPVEFSDEGRDEFHLVHIEEGAKKHSLMPLRELPRFIDNVFCHGHQKVTDLASQGIAHNDFRSFAINAM